MSSYPAMDRHIGAGMNTYWTLSRPKMLGNSLNHGPDFVDSHRHTDEGLVVSASVIPFSAALARIPRSLLEILYASLQMYLQTTFPVRQIREHMTKLKSLKRKK